MSVHLYRTIVSDPPWLERGGGKSKRGADRHYPLMDKKRIAETMRLAPEWSLAPSCHLWLWATSNFLPDALWVMQALGFEYKTSAVWVKTDVVEALAAENEPVETEPLFDSSGKHIGYRLIEELNLRSGMQIGLGQYMRHAHEWLLLGTRGKAMVPEPANRMPSVIFAPRTKHSRKPIEAYRLIESTSPGPRLEMFAREPRDGWSVFGNEVGDRKPKPKQEGMF